MTSTKEPDLISKIISNIDPDAPDESEIRAKAFDYTDEFVDKYFSEDFCQIVVNSIDKSTDLRKIGRLMDILIWSTPDNGTKLDQLTKNWIKSDNITKIEIQLSRKDWLPELEEWEIESERIKSKFPRLKDLCNFYDDEVILWNKSRGRRTDKLTQELKKING